MRKFILTLIVNVLSIGIFAQNAGNGASLEGSVKKADGQSLEAATVSLFRAADSALVKMGLTDKQGQFVVEGIPAGTYFMEVTAIGYEPHVEKNLELSAASRKQMTAITLQQASKALGAVTVTARRPLIEQ